MKVLFLQNIGNLIGGIVNVNNVLADEFHKDGNDIYIYSIRKGGEYNSEIHGVKYGVINTKRKWGCILYSEVLKQVKEFHIIKAINLLKSRIIYNFYLNIDYRKLRREINKINPDYIIVSHYEILKEIPKKYLKRTINHYHTNFGQVLQHKSQLKLFLKYKDKIKKFVWLTKASCSDAEKYGIKNSIYIYNSTVSAKFREEKKEKKLVFLARYSPEKRLDMAIQIFNTIIKQQNLNEWKLDLYIVGELDKEIKTLIESSKNVNYKGSIDNPYDVLYKYSGMMMTSSYEGFPLTVIEAAQCGVPTIAFDFGESSTEVIEDNVTGIIVERDNIEQYKNKLSDFMSSEEYRNEMSKNCIQYVNNFSIQSIKKDWYGLFKEESNEKS